MTMGCNVCQGTGFVNFPDDIDFSKMDNDEILEWIFKNEDETYSDFKVCNCCGNGEDNWYGEPGQHYSSLDPIGKNGPYAYNGGLCECH
jgi:hypothetical protein